MSKSILVVSQRGITASSFLYKFAQEIELQKLDLDVDYAAILTLEEKLKKKSYDIILVSPNVRHWQQETENAFKNLTGNAKILPISEEDFQYMNVPHIVAQIEKEGEG